MEGQCFSTSSRGKESEEENMAPPQGAEFQAGGISALVGGAPPPSPPPEATASLLLWSVEVRGTRGFLGALEVVCPGRQVRTLLFRKLGNSCEPALDFS